MLANTRAPLPVSSVTAAMRLTLDGVARNAATLAARPVIPVDTGSPVQLVSTPADGVPSAGVVNTAFVKAGPEPITTLWSMKLWSEPSLET